MLKLSILLSKLDFSTMGDLRADLVGEAERLEGVEEVREVISRECEKADTVPVKERKPLLGYSSNYPMHVAISNDGRCNTVISDPELVRRWAKDGVRIAQVMQPDDDHCPTQYIDGVQLDCEIEWAIYGTGGNVWLSFRGGEYTWRDAVYHAKRFTSKKEAQAYINAKSIAAIPFPVPKIKEEK